MPTHNTAPRFTVNIPTSIPGNTKPNHTARVVFLTPVSVVQEVKKLEGTLADYNLAVDKARTTADPGEVTKYLHDLEDQNRWGRDVKVTVVTEM